MRDSRLRWKTRYVSGLEWMIPFRDDPSSATGCPVHVGDRHRIPWSFRSRRRRRTVQADRSKDRGSFPIENGRRTAVLQWVLDGSRRPLYLLRLGSRRFTGTLYGKTAAGTPGPVAVCLGNGSSLNRRAIPVAVGVAAPAEFVGVRPGREALPVPGEGRCCQEGSSPQRACSRRCRARHRSAVSEGPRSVRRYRNRRRGRLPCRPS